ncbi:MAG: site-specific DNA-methyltransferase [Planctomycetaceae bacterium]|jgi:site-specific DNA-methyltransferase (adenine-specific)|nr:site-specific DNA-methyltransferase [Planctomycetaceae bacterium]
MPVEPFGRLDNNPEIRQRLLPYCRLKSGDIWSDPVCGHKVGVLDAAKIDDVQKVFGEEKATLAVQDPPYNVAVGAENTDNLFKWNLQEYMAWSKRWIENNLKILSTDASIYIWLGADQREHFQPLPDFMIMMRDYAELASRSFITMRNQRGYGTQKNWMAVRQECLYYTKGNPIFNVDAEYTDIPKILRGYYKDVNGQKTENFERSKSENIRAGNVWVDIQQVFYRLQENVTGCYAQKPMKSIERIVKASSQEGDLITDFFAHSGTTLLVGELFKRRVYTFDIDPVFAELTIRRLEHFRKTGKTGFQCVNPFPEIADFVIERKQEELPKTLQNIQFKHQGISKNHNFNR